jgi:hypothetical protein
LRWPLVVGIALCALAILAATVSFIAPLLGITVPVGALLIAASAGGLGPSTGPRTADGLH